MPHRFRVEGGQLKSINPYYDPAPLKEAQTRARRAQMKAVTDAYFAGLAQRDVSAVPWAADVTLRSPLAPGGLETPLVGGQAVRDWFAGLYPVLGETKVLEHYYNEDLTVIAVRADVGITTPPSTLRVVDRFTINAAGEITARRITTIPGRRCPQPSRQPCPHTRDSMPAMRIASSASKSAASSASLRLL